MNMMATRGCPFDCVFCSVHTIMGKKLRKRTLENVMEEIDYLVKKYEIQEIFFEDDNLTADIAWAKKLFQEIIKRGYQLDLYFRNGLRADCVDFELLKLIKQAGGKRVWFAPESGSQKTLDTIIKKRLKLSDVEKSIQLAKKAGLAVTCFLVIGFPEEDRNDIEETIYYGKKLRTLGCDNIWVSCAVPYPGTRLFQECVQKGILSEKIDYQNLSTMDSVIFNDSFTSKELKKIRDKAMLELNPLSIKQRVSYLIKRLPIKQFFVNHYYRFRMAFK